MAAHLSPDPSPGPSVEDILMQVDRDNVLDVHRAVTEEYHRLQRIFTRSPILQSGIPHCGDDPVSKQASVAFAERTENLIAKSQEYNLRLQNIAAALENAARQYGYTEDEISAVAAIPNAAATDLAGGLTTWLRSC